MASGADIPVIQLNKKDLAEVAPQRTRCDGTNRNGFVVARTKRVAIRLRLSFGLLVLLAPLFARGPDKYERETMKLSDLMHWRTGEVIAEIGAGEGEMSFFAAARVGPTGHVYTTELDPAKLAHLEEKVNDRKARNISVIKADATGTNLRDDCCGAIFMRRVYHHFTNPEQTDAALFRDLNPGGLLAVIDFPPSKGLPLVENAPPSHGKAHGVPKNIVEAELAAAGFTIVNEPKDWPNDGYGDYCIIAQKPARR